MLIGEVARRSGVSTRMLRHYDSLGLVRPTGRTVGGYRQYSDADIRSIFHVESLRSLGLSLREIAQVLADQSFTPQALVSDLIRRTEERLVRERELLERLRAVENAEPGDWRDVLRIVQLVRTLGSSDPHRRLQAVLNPADNEPVPTDLLAAAVLAEAEPNMAGALRWALSRAGDEGLVSLATGLTVPDVEVRRRAVLAVAEIPGDAATELLIAAIDDPDSAVRGPAALAAGTRGVSAAEPVLVAMVIAGTNDVDAGEVLGALSEDPDSADRILRALTDALTAHEDDAGIRIRLIQALVELPGTRALATLRALSEDADHSVALVATAFAELVASRASQDR
ncbi:MerR family transcriptional regulator [Nocardia sp. PE-7]|uniref:MerR family transcriptional regulator n=1 Tax=Nocardia sp. PE-7 TaxID=3058426 RepID=UPI002658C53E|nr:MerR family transcriptional regulator [Nocardia sp. PE-7]WKG12469.1 MerR family transcriptional regulator [Nocardia sp. PE-7]